MQNATSLSQSLSGGLVRSFGAIVLGSVLMTLAAKYQVPFYPVPMSLQTLVAIGVGFAFGPVLGSLSIVFYLVEGALGLPVFANAPERGIGLAYMMGPTGGYLVGFVLAAATAGLLSRRFRVRRYRSALVVALSAGAMVYLPGLAWLGSMIGYGRTLLDAGFYPFLPGDLIKAGIAALVYVQAMRIRDHSKA
ncbi:biotin transporter BioY [Martelella soudanensis]|uniref:biotin transporter BioY n=1 Tax=unclassified Martelella TaxID=2629616 RepID=UPI0015E01EE0|nr:MULTISPECIES: biotin transporter BioY [unclassified Martelella]